MDVNKDETKTTTVEETTTDQPVSTDEQKVESQEAVEETTQKIEETEEEQVTLSKKDLEKLEKKAQDFDNSIILKKFAKQESKEEKVVEENKETFTMKEAEEMMDRKLRGQNKEAYESNIGEAYQEFVKANKWAADTNVMDRISGAFNPGASVTKEELVAKLSIVAQSEFPIEFNKAQEEKMRSRILVENKDIDAGDFGGGSSVNGNNNTKEPHTKEETRIANKFFNGDVEAYRKNNKGLIN